MKGRPGAYVELIAFQTNVVGHTLGGSEANVATIQIGDEHQHHHDRSNVKVQLPHQDLLLALELGIVR